MSRRIRLIVGLIPLVIIFLVPLLSCSLSEDSVGTNDALTKTANPTNTTLPPIRMANFQEAESNCENLANENRARGGIITVTLIEQSSSYCNTNYCTVHFSDKQEMQKSIFVYVGTGNNSMNRLTSGFTQDDLIIRTDDGTLLRVGETIELVFACTYNSEYESPCDYYARRLIRF